ncbi:GntR family transcriptional regulator, partial [Mesorhizobium sp.]|uniref:GntR family transcriptional regulator n=1 Tax=Mesorhizobium sp. TaxID=1871066 RepID=UPI000FE70812
DILVVRRMVEPEIVRTLAAASTKSRAERLQAHLLEEAAAREKGDRATLVRLCGEFHLLLAELAGNQVLVRLVTGLQALTCLAILLYAEREDACPPDEHSRIAAAIANNDGDLAAREMLHHLQHVEKDLQLDRDGPSLNDTIAWLRGEPAVDP